MKKKFMLTLIFLMLIFSFFQFIMLQIFISEALGTQLDEDVAQSMYFKRSSYVETDPAFGKFKEEMKSRELGEIRQSRQKRLKRNWAVAVCRENEVFKEVKDKLPRLEEGRIKERGVLRIMKKPQAIKDPSRPWLILDWRMNQYLRAGGYPYPRQVQKVLAASYFYTEAYIPRTGLRLDLLTTLNKETKLLDHFAYYLDTGYIQDYWLTN